MKYEVHLLKITPQNIKIYVVFKVHLVVFRGACPLRKNTSCVPVLTNMQS
jgi:hypothetical protein